MGQSRERTNINIILFTYEITLNMHFFFYRYYFQLLTNEAQTSQGFLGIIRRFGWKKVGIITQNENLFTVVSGSGRKKQRKGGKASRIEAGRARIQKCREGQQIDRYTSYLPFIVNGCSEEEPHTV